MDTSRVDRVEHWRKKAFDLSSSDRLGFVISRAMDLMAIVVKDGTAAKNLQFAARSLEMERTLLMEDDSEKTAPLREMVYGLCETLAITVKSIVDERSHQQLLPAAPERFNKEEMKEEVFTEVTQNTATTAFEMPHQMEVFDASSLVFPKEEEEEEEIIVNDEAEDEDSLTEGPMGAEPLPRPEPLNSGLVDLAHRFFQGSPSTSAVMHQPPRLTPKSPRKRKPSEMGRQHECDVCKKRFTTKKSMENHKLVHTGVRNHVCVLCGWEFMRRSDLLRHLKNVDHSKDVKNSDRRKFECDTCGMAFYRLADKSNHVKTMHTESTNEPTN